VVLSLPHRNPIVPSTTIQSLQVHAMFHLTNPSLFRHALVFLCDNASRLQTTGGTERDLKASGIEEPANSISLDSSSSATSATDHHRDDSPADSSTTDQGGAVSRAGKNSNFKTFLESGSGNPFSSNRGKQRQQSRNQPRTATTGEAPNRTTSATRAARTAGAAGGAAFLTSPPTRPLTREHR